MKIKIFTHIDLDGIGCAVLAYLAFGKENVDTVESPVRIAPDEFVKKYTAKLPSADPWLSNASGSL